MVVALTPPAPAPLPCALMLPDRDPERGPRGMQA